MFSVISLDPEGFKLSKNAITGSISGSIGAIYVVSKKRGELKNRKWLKSGWSLNVLIPTYHKLTLSAKTNVNPVKTLKTKEKADTG